MAIPNSSYFVIVSDNERKTLQGHFYSRTGDFLRSVDCLPAENNRMESPDQRFASMLDPNTKGLAQCSTLVFWVCIKTNRSKVNFCDKNNNVITWEYYDGPRHKSGVINAFKDTSQTIDYDHLSRSVVSIVDHETAISRTWGYRFRKWIGI